MSEERSRQGQSRDRRSSRSGRRFGRGRRQCQFCAEQIKEVNYKNLDLLKRYVTEQGKIRSRRQTGTCAKHQRMLARAVKRARHMAMLPFAADRLR